MKIVYKEIKTVKISTVGYGEVFYIHGSDECSLLMMTLFNGKGVPVFIENGHAAKFNTDYDVVIVKGSFVEE